LKRPRREHSPALRPIEQEIEAPKHWSWADLCPAAARNGGPYAVASFGEAREFGIEECGIEACIVDD